MTDYYRLQEGPSSTPHDSRFFTDQTGNTYKKPAFTVFKMKNTFISLDRAFEYVGDNSSFQKLTIRILSFQWVFYSFLTMGMPFLFTTPKWLCTKVVDGETVQTSCTEEDACSKWDEASLNSEDQSLSQEFNLYCEKKVILGFLGSLFFIGSSFAGIIFPHLADNLGRKKTMLLAVVLGGSAVFLCGFVESIYLFMLCIFTAGLCLNGYETIVYVYITEISGKRFRNISGVILATVWAAAQICFSPIAYFIHSWRILISFAIGLPLLVTTVFASYFLEESPRYLCTRKKFQEAREILSKIAKYNDRPPFEFHLYEEMDEFNERATTVRKRAKPSDRDNLHFKQFHGYWDLLANRNYRSLVVIMCYIWFFQYYMYYGIQFSLTDMGVEAHLNLIFIALGEVIAALVTAPIKLKTERKRTFFILLTMMCICCFLLFFLTIPSDCQGVCKERVLILLLTTALRFGISIFAGVLITYTSEIFPTSMRTKGYGLCMTFGKTGCIIVPIYVSYLQIFSQNPLVYIGFLSFLALFLTMYLPETFDQQMTDRLDDGEERKEVELVKTDRKKVAPQEEEDDIFMN